MGSEVLRLEARLFVAHCMGFCWEILEFAVEILCSFEGSFLQRVAHSSFDPNALLALVFFQTLFPRTYMGLNCFASCCFLICMFPVTFSAVLLSVT